MIDYQEAAKNLRALNNIFIRLPVIKLESSGGNWTWKECMGCEKEETICNNILCPSRAHHPSDFDLQWCWLASVGTQGQMYPFSILCLQWLLQIVRFSNFIYAINRQELKKAYTGSYFICFKSCYKIINFLYILLTLSKLFSAMVFELNLKTEIKYQQIWHLSMWTEC